VTPIVVGLGGALGAVARYYATDIVRRFAGDAMPWGTFAVNIAGSFALGFFLVWLQSRAPSTQAREFIGIGFLGSFTTFSTFSYEAVALARAGDAWRAGGYVAGSMIVGLLAVVAGALLASALEAQTA
jgi:fluoride exporter